MIYLIICIIPLAAKSAIVPIRIGFDEEKVLIKSGCSILQISSNYQTTHVNLSTNLYAVKQIFIKDTKTQPCDSTCHPNSIICETQESSDYNQIRIGSCIQNFYIHVYSIVESKISISAKYKDRCMSNSKSEYVRCAGLTYQECIKCGNKCNLAECVSEEEQNGNILVHTQLCLPKFVDDSELNFRCQAYGLAEYGRWVKGCKKQEKNDKGIKVSLIVGICAAVGLMVLFLFICWFRYKVKKSGKAPCWTPRIFRKCLGLENHSAMNDFILTEMK